MVELSMTLVSEDSKFDQIVLFSIATEEWKTLLNFHKDAVLLRSTQFVQNERGGEIAISFKTGQPVTSKAKTIEMDEVWALLLKLRPFLLQKENHYFHKIKNILKRRLTHPVFQKHIEEIEEAFMLRTMQKKLHLQGAGRVMLSVDVVMDWLNSFEFHKIQTKRVIVEKDLGFFGKDQNGLPIILFALVDMVIAILFLSDLIETLIEVENGTRTEVICLY
jgi:hypothetical protein